MDLSKLQLLNTETLQAMKAEIDRVLAGRLDTRPMPGRTGRFKASRDGLERVVLITRLNPKTISCTELANSVTPGANWKVSYGMLKVDPIVKKTTATPASIRPAAPQTSMAHAW